MDRSRSSGEARFARYVDDLTEVIGHADRAEPVRAYCTRMLLTLERKRVEPMAAATAPGHYEGRGWRGFHHHAMLSISA
jgi:SRSO17 transposase